jgi:hypothetical protein
MAWEQELCAQQMARTAQASLESRSRRCVGPTRRVRHRPCRSAPSGQAAGSGGDAGPPLVPGDRGGMFPLISG